MHSLNITMSYIAYTCQIHGQQSSQIPKAVFDTTLIFVCLFVYFSFFRDPFTLMGNAKPFLKHLRQLCFWSRCNDVLGKEIRNFDQYCGPFLNQKQKSWSLNKTLERAQYPSLPFSFHLLRYRSSGNDNLYKICSFSLRTRIIYYRYYLCGQSR